MRNVSVPVPAGTLTAPHYRDAIAALLVGVTVLPFSGQQASRYACAAFAPQGAFHTQGVVDGSIASSIAGSIVAGVGANSTIMGLEAHCSQSGDLLTVTYYHS